MELKGKIKSISRDWVTDKCNITFEVNDIPTEELQELITLNELQVNVTKPVKKRSLKANAYFHVLSDKLADKLGNSKPYQKNLLLHEYGCKELNENSEQITIWVKKEVDMLNRSDIHCVAKGYKGDFIEYGLLKKTRFYDSYEMSKLIDGTVEDAKQQGIEVLPPKEIERMLKAWKH